MKLTSSHVAALRTARVVGHRDYPIVVMTPTERDALCDMAEEYLNLVSFQSHPDQKPVKNQSG